MNCKIWGERISSKDSFSEKCGAGLKEEPTFKQGFSEKPELNQDNVVLYRDTLGLPQIIP